MDEDPELEREDRFSFIYQPIKELAKNWDIDLSAELESYVEDLHRIAVTYSDGKTSLNFARAGLFIQGSVAVYGKKVDYLYQLTNEFMKGISKKKKKGNDEDNDADNDGEGGREEEAEEEDDKWMNLNNMKENNHILLKEEGERKEVFLSTPMPMSLIPLEDFEKTDVPLLSRKGDVIGKKDDFKINTCYLHHTGALLLDVCNEDLVGAVDDVTLLGFEDHSEPSIRPPPSQSPQQGDDVRANSPDLAEASMCSADDGMEGEFSAVEIHRDAGTMLAVPHALEQRGSTSLLPVNRMTRSNGQITLRPSMTPLPPPPPNPWDTLDPYNVVGREKPTKRGRPYISTAAREAREQRKRIKAARQLGRTITEGTFLSEFIRKEFFTHRQKLPKNQCKAPSWPALEDVYIIHQKVCQEQKRTQRRGQRDNHIQGAEERREEVNEVATDSDTDYGDQGDSDGGLADEDFEVNPHDDNPFSQPTETTGGDRPFSQMGYEELVKSCVQQYLKKAKRHMMTSDLTRRVQSWEDRIRPTLEEEEKRRPFDIHLYGSEILAHFQEVGDERGFTDIGRGKPQWEVCRYFLSSLMMANTHNLEVKDEKHIDSMSLKFLSNQRHHEQFQGE